MKKGRTASEKLLISISLFCIVLVSACSSFNVEKVKPSKNLEIGDETVAATETVPSSGGSMVVNAEGSEIDGLEIVVSPQSYPTEKTFKISTAPILNHTLGQYFNPLTPLIQIENGGGYADGIMEITIPVIVPEGDIPLGFYYDEITGTLEAIPVKEYTSTSITLLTRHFMSASDLTPSTDNLKAGGIKIDPTSNLVISSIAESVLKGKTIISSGYRVGKDDWEFPNYGSYLATGGHCSGQNMCAMWYYFEKKLKGEGDLFGKFSATSTLWQDNAIGYRFCSVIHKDLEWKGRFIDLFDKYIDKNQERDKLKLYMIAGAMLTTGEPQGIGIYRPTVNDDGTAGFGGHDLICYQVAVNEGKLYISDPNKPGVEQFIEFKNNKFEPYIAKLNGRAASHPYPFVTWYAKTAYIEWDKIGKRYADLLDSTIGNKTPNIFPPYTIWVKGKADSQLKDGFSSNSDTLRLMVECPTTERGFNVGGKWYIWYNMFDKNGNRIDVSEGSGKGYTTLKPGLNKIGVYIFSKKTSAVDEDGNYSELFVDFKWFNVYYSTLKIDPNPIVDEPGKEVTITAMSGGTAPSNSKYVWNFGDGSKEVTVKNDSIVKHKFSKEGDYDVIVELYDNASGAMIGMAKAEANIANGILSRLQKYKYISIDFNADFKGNNEIVSFSMLSIDNSPPWGSTQKCPLVWSGASFTTNFDYSWELFSGEQVHSTGTISGTMSANGMIMRSFTAHETSFYPESKDTYNYDVSVKDVPYQPDYEYDEYSPRFGADGATVSQYINSCTMRWDFIDSDGVAQALYSTSINYNDPDDEPYLHITFSGSN
jgi:hypothetical protein